jgi:beta-lactam-binding protein with PASTA domain
MTGTLVIVGVLLALLAWFFWPSSDPGSRDIDPGRRPGVDVAELEAAEREVQDAANKESVRDWGPGTGQKPLP